MYIPVRGETKNTTITALPTDIEELKSRITTAILQTVMPERAIQTVWNNSTSTEYILFVLLVPVILNIFQCCSM